MPKATVAVVKTSLELPEPLWKAARMRAAEDRTNLRAVIVAALERYLAPARPATTRRV